MSLEDLAIYPEYKKLCDADNEAVKHISLPSVACLNQLDLVNDHCSKVSNWKRPNCFYTDITDNVDMTNISFQKCYLMSVGGDWADKRGYAIAFCKYFKYATMHQINNYPGAKIVYIIKRKEYF